MKPRLNTGEPIKPSRQITMTIAVLLLVTSAWLSGLTCWALGLDPWPGRGPQSTGWWLGLVIVYWPAQYVGLVKWREWRERRARKQSS
jgi:hypothetical protein